MLACNERKQLILHRFLRYSKTKQENKGREKKKCNMAVKDEKASVSSIEAAPISSREEILAETSLYETDMRRGHGPERVMPGRMNALMNLCLA